jgi:hypothetical protein
LTLHSASAFQHVFLTVGNTGQSLQPSGFWQLDLPAPVTDVTLIVIFGSSLPTTPFDLQFQTTNVGGSGGNVVPLTTTLSSNPTATTPTVVATYTPNPAPFLGGAACLLSLQQGCLWEFKVVLQEFNGVQVSGASYNDTFTFGSTVTNGNPVLVTIPPRGFATVVRNLTCPTAGASCLTADQQNGGTYTFTIVGTDANGVAFNFTGPVLPLSKPQ